MQTRLQVLHCLLQDYLAETHVTLQPCVQPALSHNASAAGAAAAGCAGGGALDAHSQALHPEEEARGAPGSGTLLTALGSCTHAKCVCLLPDVSLQL